MRRLIALTLAATSLGSSFLASATGLGVTSPRVSAGSAAIARCDADGFTLGYTTSAGNVTSVTVNGIADPGCEGADLSVALTNSTGAAIASGGPQTLPTDGDTADNSLTLSVNPNPAAEQVSGFRILVVEP
jgi:hypothetical protein